MGLIDRTTYNLESLRFSITTGDHWLGKNKQTSNAWGLRFLKTKKNTRPLEQTYLSLAKVTFEDKICSFSPGQICELHMDGRPSLNTTKTPQNRSRRDEDFIGFPDFKGTPNRLNDKPGLNETWVSQTITRESQKTFWMNSDHMNIDSHNIVFVQHLKTSHCHTHTC